MEFNSNKIELSTIFPNPENPMEIKIPLFEGPLDLLLHLIRKKEVSITEVRLSELTSSYLEYLEKLQSINLDLAGDFLLSGYRILGSVTCVQGGHSLSNLFLRTLLKDRSNYSMIELEESETIKTYIKTPINKLAVNA